MRPATVPVAPVGPAAAGSAGAQPLGQSYGATPRDRRRPLVDGVDHDYIPMADAPNGFAVLTEELELPVMWPFTSFGDFASGGVSVGSIKVEVIEANAAAPWRLAQEPP